MTTETSSKQFAESVTKSRSSKTDDFFKAHIRLTFIYTFTTAIIMVGFSLVIYKTLLVNFTDSIQDIALNLDPDVTTVILRRAQDIFQNRILTADGIILFFVIVISFFLTQKTLEPIKSNLKKEKQFIADASHELRTPISIAISGLEVSLRNKTMTVDAAREALGDALSEIRELSELTTQLLDISKYDAGIVDTFAQIPIANIITSVADKMTPLASEQGINITSHGEPAVLLGNPEEIKRVLVNIIKNAITHTHFGGSITVTGSNMPSEYSIVITDTGVGIPANSIDKIFDPFFQADRSRSGGGAGLGLALSKKIIDKHHGTIRVASEQGVGTSVTIMLPRSTSLELHSADTQ